MRHPISWIAIVLVGLGPAMAAEKTNLIEHVQAGLARDASISEAVRAELLAALRQELGAYAFDVLSPGKRAAADAVTELASEGLDGGVSPARTAAVAAAIYRAMARGAPAELASGIARYGFQRALSADRIAALSDGASELLRFDVPRPVVEDLIRNAVQGDWSEDSFRTYKWALVRAKRAGHDPERFARYLMARHARGRVRPGAVAAEATRAFDRAARAGRPPPSVAYRSPVLDPVPAPRPSPKQPSRADRLAQLMRALESFLGTPYVWGGRSRQGTDCSGMTQAVYAQVGLEIGRRVQDQWKAGRPVARSALQAGDLVFFRTVGNRISHVGMVTDPSKDEFIHASSTRGVVRSRLSSSYYKTRYAGARRVF